MSRKARKVKCSEERPVCRNCRASDRRCSYEPPFHQDHQTDVETPQVFSRLPLPDLTPSFEDARESSQSIEDHLNLDSGKPEPAWERSTDLLSIGEEVSIKNFVERLVSDLTILLFLLLTMLGYKIRYMNYLQTSQKDSVSSHLQPNCSRQRAISRGFRGTALALFYS